jgi:hypothetical protein
MDASTFWTVRNELYERPDTTSDPTYYCRGCGWELDNNRGHAGSCPVGWFERTFFQQSFYKEAHQ